MLLEQAFHRAVDEGACHLFTVLGTAGIGKSRLVNELVAELGDEARVLVGRCVPYGEGITFLPLTELVRGAGGILVRDSADEAGAKLARLVRDDPERDLIVERLAAATGLGEGTSSSSSTMCSGPLPHSLISSTTSSTRPGTLRSCSSASPALTSSTSGRPGAEAS
jgi:predicted ATPase